MGPAFRLSGETGSLGLNCAEAGVSLAGAPLLRKTAFGFAARPKAELSALMKAAYGGGSGDVDLSPRLTIVAEALNKGDLGRAKIAAVQMRLPDLSWDGAIRIARTEERLAKYDPNEPRDRQGRWTTGAGGAPDNTATSPKRPIMLPRHGRTNPAPSAPPQSATVVSGPAHLYGGRLIHTGGGGPGDNEPPPDPIPIPEAEPDYAGIRVPQGWDTPGITINGLYYPPTRNPTLPSGALWPRATHDAIKAALAPNGGRQAPEVVIYVPIDKIGPLLMGETRDEDFQEPRGYSAVKLIGTPQVTYSYSRGEETGHAADGIREALEMAGTNQFSEIFFNRTLMTSTGGTYQNRIRPDVLGVVRSGLENNYIYHPYETLSPGQEIKDREEFFNNLPGFRPFKGQHYKLSGLMISPYYRLLS